MPTLSRALATSALCLALLTGTSTVPTATATSPHPSAPASSAHADATSLHVTSAASAAAKTSMVGSGQDSRSLERLYRAYFLREPDASGLAHWKAQQAAGMSIDAISAEFARSAEFANRYGALDNRAFVTLVYTNVLARTPDAAGYAHWTGALASGLSRGKLMVGFSDSEEYKRSGSPVTTAPDAPTVAPPSSAPPGPGTPSAPGTNPYRDVDTSRYSFMATRDTGEPHTFPPCSTIKVVANFTGAPPGSRAALTTTLAALTTATGNAWVFAGETTERAPASVDQDRPSSDPARYGPGYSPVLVSWPAVWDEPAGVVGRGGWVGGMFNSTVYAVTGSITLSSLYRPADTTYLTSLMLHEFGHVANLGHVAHDDEVMSAVLHRPHTAYQRGDRAGLWKVGSFTSDCANASTAPLSPADASMHIATTFSETDDTVDLHVLRDHEHPDLHAADAHGH